MSGNNEYGEMSDDEEAAFARLPRFAQDGDLEGADLRTPQTQNWGDYGPRFLRASPEESSQYEHSQDERSQDEHSQDEDSHDEDSQYEDQPSLPHQDMPEIVSPSTRPDAPHSLAPTPQIYVSGPGSPSTQTHMFRNSPPAFTYGISGIRAFMDDPNAYLQDDPSEGYDYHTPVDKFHHDLPREASSSSRETVRTNQSRSQTGMSVQPSPAAQPPVAAPSPYLPEYGSPKYIAQYVSPQHQATGYAKRTHDHLSPSSQEGERSKGKQRQESPGSQPGGQGHASVPGPDDFVYDLTESPGPDATYIYHGQAGGGYEPETHGESSAQGAAQHQYDAMQGINPSVVLFNQSGAGAGLFQPQRDTSFPEPDRGRAGELSDAPAPAPIPALVPAPAPGHGSRERLHPLEFRNHEIWGPGEMKLLEIVIAGMQDLEEGFHELRRIFNRRPSACQYKWNTMKRKWNIETEDDYLRSLRAEPANWDYFTDQYNLHLDRQHPRERDALIRRFRLLRRSNLRYNIGNTGL